LLFRLYSGYFGYFFWLFWLFLPLFSLSFIFMVFSAAFESFLSSLSEDSQSKYRVRILQYKNFMSSRGETQETLQSVQDFIVEMKEKYMTSTLWSLFSIIKSYFQYEYNLDLGQSLPGVVRLLKQWEKVEETTKSKILNFICIFSNLF
jgi:hypothetical protein